MMKFTSSLSCLVIFALIVQNHSISENRLCVDEKCIGVISLGKTIKNYLPNEEGVLSFKVNSEVKIKSKSSDSHLWGVEIDGKNGYAPKLFIQETKVFHKKNSLVAGVPEIPAPIRRKSKLKSSEAPKPELEATTTAPLPTELGSEKIVTEGDGNGENPVSVSPAQPIEVVDGTEIPMDIETVTKPEVVASTDEDEGIVEDIEIESTNRSTSRDDIPLDDEDDEYDDDEEHDDDFIEEEEEEIVEQNIAPEEKENELETEVNNGTEIPSNLLYPNLVQTESKPDAEISAAAVELKGTSSGNASDAPMFELKPLSIALETNETESFKKQDSEPSLDQRLKEQLSKATPDADQSAEFTSDSKPEVVNKVSENISTEKEPTGAEEKNVSTLTMEQSTVPGALIPDVPAVASNASVIHEKVISEENLKSPYTEEPKIETKAEILSDAVQVDAKSIDKLEELEHKTDTEADTKIEPPFISAEANLNELGAGSTETVNLPLSNSKESEETAKPEILIGNVDTPSLEAPSALKNLQEEQTNFTESVTRATTIDNVSIASKLSTEGTQNPIDVVTPILESVQEKTEEDIPIINAGTESTETKLTPESKTNTENTENVATKLESAENTPNEASLTNDLNYISTLGVQAVPEQSANPITSDTLETIEEAEQTVKIDDHDVVSSKEAASELPPITLNELLKSANTRSLNQDKLNELPINNDLSSENEDVTKVPEPTEPQSDVLNNDLFEFDVTTSNPVPPVAVPPKVSQPSQPQVGLFQTILGTVKGFLPSQEPTHKTEFSDELDRILFSKKEVNHAHITEQSEEYCERDDSCPPNVATPYHDEIRMEKDFIKSLSEKVLEIFDVLSCMVISAAATLLFTFGYYCLSQFRKENELIAKLNVVERSLLASNKEASILKHDLGETCDKLASIENNSFGSNDMVIAVKKELEVSEETKSRLEEQIVLLEKELENAAEAGLELNKIVSELLNNQSGDESIISSVEELQRQLNEQQHTILEINAILAEKSRENSELQLILAEQNAKFGGEIASLQQDNDELEGEKNILKSKLDEMKTEFELDITKALEGKNAEIKRLQADIMSLRTKAEEEHRKWQTSVAKVEALEDCLKTVKRDPSIKVSQIIDVANVQAELLDIQRQRTSLKEKLDSETDARKLLEDQVKFFSEEVEKLKHNFHQSEKDKLEAQTRLEVLSNYFKDKENQLQKELSLKEAMWLKQQGETTSTVDRLTNMQEEIQTLKSQNDSLRAEIEAQVAAHKAQIGTLENRAHETWLAARQSERRYEEARSEAAALRRKLTSLVGGTAHNLNKENNLDVNLAPPDLNNAPSPIHMEPPGSPILGRMPPPPFVPPSFLGPPLPHFMGIPPFIPPGEMRPPPMGRLMSPPPPPGAQHMRRYSATDDDDDEDEIREHSRGHWRDTYSPPRHSYRYSPDRYLYNSDLISNYDTENEFSPPPSPRERSHRSGSRSGSYKAYSPPPQSANSQSMDRPKKSSKGQMSSGSEKSCHSWKGKSKGMV